MNRSNESFLNCDWITTTTTYQKLNLSLNETDCQLEHAPTLSKSAVIRTMVLSVMAFASLMGNVATIWNIYQKRLSRRLYRHNCSAIYTLILHLSISDILVTGFCLFGEAAWSYTVEWLAGNLMCKAFKFFQMFSLYLSTYVLVLIGIDRWVAVRYPMKSLNTKKRCNRLLVGAYVFSLILSIPQCLIFRVAQGPFIEEFSQCVTHGFYTAVWQEQLYTTFTLIFMFIIPLAVIISSYLSTFRTIAGSAQVFQLGPSLSKLRNGYHNARSRLIHKAKMKSLRISFVIVLAFVVCWTPYYTMMLIFMFWDPDKTVSEDLQSGIFFFGMSNSLVNPMIYGAFHLYPYKKNRFNNNSLRLGRDNSTLCHHSANTTVCREEQIHRSTSPKVQEEKESLMNV